MKTLFNNDVVQGSATIDDGDKVVNLTMDGGDRGDNRRAAVDRMCRVRWTHRDEELKER